MGQLLTEEEAATYLSLSPRTLQTWRSKLVGPPYMKPPGVNVVRYRAEDLEKWVEESMQSGQA